MTAEYTPEQTPPRQCPECGGLFGHTADCVYREEGAAVEALTPEQRQRFMHAADAALRVRRNILLLAAHASGHRKHPHGDSCETCKERWPCVSVLRAAGPSLNAVADLPSLSPPTAAEQVSAARAVADEVAADTARALGDTT